MFGSNPLRSVTGASAGKVESESTATIWSPAPMANRISVATVEMETMRAGACLTASVVLGMPEMAAEGWVPPQPARTRAASSGR